MDIKKHSKEFDINGDGKADMVACHPGWGCEKIISKHSGQTMEKVHADSDRDYWMKAEEAKAYGMIDEILIRK